MKTPEPIYTVSSRKACGELRSEDDKHIGVIYKICSGWYQVATLVEFSSKKVDKILGVYKGSEFKRSGGMDLGYAYIKFYTLKHNDNQ